MAGVLQPIPGVIYMPQSDLDRYVEAGIIGDEGLIDAYKAGFKRFPTRVAISEPGIEITYAELDRITDLGGAALWRLGLRPTDRVLFQMRNCKELIYVLLSCLKIGVIPVCTLAAHRQAEIGQLGRLSEAKVHFIHGDDTRFDMVAFAQEMKSTLSSIDHIVAVRNKGDNAGVLSFETMIQAENADDARKLLAGITLDPYQVSFFQLSGGTSGIAKIIPRFSNEYLYCMRTMVEWHKFDQSLVAFTANPMMHNAPLLCMWGPAFLCGGEVAIASGPSLGDLEEVLVARKPTWLGLAKVHMLRLKEAGAFNRAPTKQITGAIVTDNAVASSRFFGFPCWPIFGMTEGALAFGHHSDPEEALAASVGQPLSPFETFRIVEPGTEMDVPLGTPGEFLVRGPCTTRGYYNMPEQNKAAFTADGFYRSGDLLSQKIIDGKVYLFFEGRVKDVVDRGGEKINCGEVESSIGLHPSVGEVACVGMPDPVYGERLCAMIVLREGKQRLSVAELGNFLLELGLAKFKLPERIEHVEALMMTTSGKPSKPLMREYVAKRIKAEAEISAGNEANA